MAMTASVKDELSRLAVTKPCCRKAEVSSTLRFAGGLHLVGGRIEHVEGRGRLTLLTSDPQTGGD